ncbi:hypothetical protein P3T76_005894 [Phytophthora citrophthora]|uniref:Uncharacterized protein n=1 Tax=Phytophthora citrophthora TaxID=4793 RepID=A0AAD9LMI6_9STRA|nr:hypothetical protein P3T76_005894 [Phytophthora citrophthora]
MFITLCVDPALQFALRLLRGACVMQTDTASRRRGTGEREKFHFYLPFVGHVRRTAFAHCLGMQPLTVQRYKRRVEGNIATKKHGNKLNKNVSTIDAVWLVRWFKEFASEVGEVVPVRVRMQKTKDGVVNKYYSREDYTLLPPTFTWDVLYDEMHKYVAKGLRVNEPARTTFRKLLSIHYPTVKIRSAQSNPLKLFGLPLKTAPLALVSANQACNLLLKIDVEQIDANILFFSFTSSALPSHHIIRFDVLAAAPVLIITVVRLVGIFLSACIIVVFTLGGLFEFCVLRELDLDSLGGLWRAAVEYRRKEKNI